MLQFITKISDRYSVAEEARMAVEGGCRWIQLSAVSVEHNEGVLRDVAHSLVALCSENEAFMIIENDVGFFCVMVPVRLWLKPVSAWVLMPLLERYAAALKMLRLLKGLMLIMWQCLFRMKLFPRRRFILESQC